MNTLYGFCGLAFCFACLGVVLKQLGVSVTAAYKAAAALCLGFYMLSLVTPVVDFVKSLTEKSELSVFFSVPIKALGVALLCSLAADICRDCDETTLASCVETAGKAMILLLSLPLAQYLLEAFEAFI